MEEREKSSTGLEENVAGFFCYLFVFITGIVFLVVEKKSSFVKFHAMQSTITFLGLFVVSIIIGSIPVINLLSILIWILGLIKGSLSILVSGDCINYLNNLFKIFFF